MVYNKVLITIFRNFKENNKSYSKTTNILMTLIILFWFVIVILCSHLFYFVYCEAAGVCLCTVYDLVPMYVWTSCYNIWQPLCMVTFDVLSCRSINTSIISDMIRFMFPWSVTRDVRSNDDEH